jgi:fibro-slime domain-containing protein
MNSLPGARLGASVSPRLGSRHALSLVGFTALALIAGCGAGGETGDTIVTGPENGGAPAVGGGGNNGGLIPVPGSTCTGANCELAGGEPVAPPNCGDGALTSDEACDDGNKVSGDGCSDTCLLAEPGFSCATPGQACRQIARCGDGVAAPTELCDDGNVNPGDGCSNRCRVELGKKCEGSPSVCTDAICGNSVREGAEACDDGNTNPFDGCSPICLREPTCGEPGVACTSECGDGLLIDEACDDGNLIDGDGCSATCSIEGGFTCVAEAACELLNEQCVLRVPAVFRDFPANHPDFLDAACSTLVVGAVANELNASGRPSLSGAPAVQQACLSNEQNFQQWYTDVPGTNVSVVGELLLFDNGEGGYVNRYGAQGEQFTAIRAQTERQAGASLAACSNTCLQEAQNGNGFDGPLRCADRCRPVQDDRQQLENGQFQQLNNQLTQAQNAAVPDADAIAALEVQIAEVQAELDALDAAILTCQSTCQEELDARVAICSTTCKPCGANPALFCLGGVVDSYDGSPVFFPVDTVPAGPTVSSARASIPAQYGYDAFPFEDAVFPGAPTHNFDFTSEVQYWFQYDANTNATLRFLGDDDVWVYLNGRLAVDLGGLHVPSTGVLTINAAANTVTSTVTDGATELQVGPGINATPAGFGLEDGNVYTISIFHAERKLTGSSFQLTLAGFEATPSDCTANCGDNVLSFGEECDDGVNDGGYGECNPGCVLGPFCGDGVQQAEFGETCDVGPGGDGVCRGCREIRIQ